MDAYIFAYNASSQARADAVAAVGANGPARVALPASGDRNLYVAVAGSTSLELTTRVAQILAISGIGATETYIPSTLGNPPPHDVPTHGAVDSWIGHGIVVCSSANLSAVHSAIAALNGVIGLCVITGAGPLVLVEVTGSTQSAVNGMLENVDAVQNVDDLYRVVGERANGAGFTAI